MPRSRRLLAAFPLLLIALVLAAAPAGAQSLWTDIAESTLRVAPGARVTTPSAYRTVRLDVPQMAARLGAAPARLAAGDASHGTEVEIPLPEGGAAVVRVVEAPVMAPELQARYPEIRTYLAQGAGGVTGRLSLTPAGFRGLLLTPGGAVYVDPYARGDAEHYVVYYSRDLVADPAVRGRLEEEVIGHMEDASSRRGDEARPHGSTLRTYRLAVAATGEYTQYHGGTVAGALAAIVVTMNRVTGIYERDIAVSFQLIPTNDQIIFTNPATDPYSNTSGDLNANITTINSIIGLPNYDVGHLVGTGGGGVAGLSVICTSSKARGLTGSSQPIGDAFDVDYVAHEIGHQFGGNHTMSGCGSVPANARVEPGSGSTIQAYAGICGSENLQSNSDAYFHGFSLDEMTAHVTTGSGGTCGVTTETNNPIPVVTVPTGFTIPARTPFSLTGSATDDTPDALTYTWEGFNPGGSGVGGTGAPYFRSFTPSASPTRHFPKFDRLVAGLPPVIGERLPTSSQTLTFRLTARDNRAGAGAINDASTTVTVDGSAGPFVVTFASAPGQSYGGTATVTWNVAGTNAGAVNAATVDILYSTDNGATFPFTLVEDTPNTGSRLIGFPATTTQGRILVRASDNVFYNVNPRPFAVTATGTTPPNSPPPILALSETELSATLAAGGTATRELSVFNTAVAGAQDLLVTASVEDLSQPQDVVSPTQQAARAARDARRAALAADPSLATPAPARAKTDADPAAGAGAARREGGPDAFGYTFQDSSEPGGPVFDWVDISTTGAAVTLGDDAVSAAIPLPFPFPFYGADQTSVRIVSNGYLTFGTTGNTGASSYENQTLPAPAVPNHLIAMYWDDLNPSIGGSIRHRDMGDGRFVVQFTGVPHYNTASEANTFQAILHADGQIDLQYLTMTDDADEPNGHSIGIENADGTDGLSVVANAPYVSNNLAIRFSTPGVPWASVAPASQTIAPGASGVFTTTFEAGELPTGTYTGTLRLTSNDPTRPSATVPLTLVVNGVVSAETGAPAVLALGAARPNPMRSISEIPFSLAEAGVVRMTLTDLLGREVAVLVEGERGPGAHSETLDGARLAPGVYVVRLATDGQVLTQRLVVVR